MSKIIKYNDYVQISPDQRILSLDKVDKVKLIDNMLERSHNGGKGLVITYDLSHSGRRINNRIYSTKGQQKGIDSLINPYPKPILKNHNQSGEPIGRFIGGEWQNLYDEAKDFLQSSQAVLDIHNAFAGDDPEKIYDTLKAMNLIENKQWPGLGRMRVQANITDEDAIKKFMDGRYLTFSAGSTTDRHVCSICSTDWSQNGMCEHRHGKTYDGEICVFITGDFSVLEGSVVNTPADDLSQLVHMQMMDSVDSKEITTDENIHLEEFILTDSIYNFGETNGLQTTKETINKKEEVEEKEKIVDEKYDHQMTIDESAMKELHDKGVTYITESSGGKPMIIKINYSGSMKNDFFKSSSLYKGVSELELARFKKSFSEMIADFDIDGYKQDELVAKELYKISIKKKDFKMLDKETTKELDLQVELEDSSNEQEEANVEVEEAGPVKEPEQLPQDEDVDETLDGEDSEEIDWGLLDLAMQGILIQEDSQLSVEDRNELSDSVFCGPERSFPIADCAHVKAATVLVERYKCSDSIKAKIMAAVEEKANVLSCDEPKEVTKLRNDFDKLQEQYLDLENKFKTVLEAVVLKSKKKDEEMVEIEADDDLIDNNITILDKKVENPSEHIQDETISSKKKEVKLPSFEQKIVDEYRRIKNKDGEYSAQLYLSSKSLYLPKGFNPNKF